MLDERYLSQLKAHRARLLRAAARMLGTAAEAEDVVQDSYLRALEAGGEPPPDSMEAWLSTVMHNLAIDRLRRRGWMQRWLHDAAPEIERREAPSAEAAASLAEQVDRALREIAARLPAADCAIVLLHEVFDFSYAEIAAASRKTEAGCRQQAHRALMRLHRSGEASEPDDEPEADAVLHALRQALLRLEAAPLLAMLQQPATRAQVANRAFAGSARAACRSGSGRRPHPQRFNCSAIRASRSRHRAATAQIRT